jgi:hypothetical protein
MKEELIVSLTADIKDLSAKLKEAQNQLQSFSDETQRDFNGITLDNLESQLQALNTELKNTSIGSIRFKELGDEISKVESKVKTAFNSIAKVGTSGFNGLNNSINQITRELPAFGLSANIGFLAISNNIPILIDEINRLKVANQGLIDKGEPTKSVFKSITGALLSYQTALSLGVTLMTIYGGKIVEMLGSIGSNSNKVNLLKEELGALNGAYESKSVAKAITDTYLLAEAFNQAKKDVSLQKGVLDEYNKTINKGNTAQTDFNKASQDFILQTDSYIQSVIARAAADILAADAAQEYIELEKRKAQREKNAVELAQLNQSLTKNDANAAAIRQFNLVAAAENQQKIYDTEIKNLEANIRARKDLISKFAIDFTVISSPDDTKEKERKEKEARDKKVRGELAAVQEIYTKSIVITNATAKSKEQAEIKLLEAQIRIFEKYKQYDEQYAKDSLDTRTKLAEKTLSISDKAKEEKLKLLEEEYKTDDAFMQKSIDDQLDAIDEKYIKIKEGAILSSREQQLLDLKQTREKIAQYELVKQAGEKYSDEYVKLKDKESALLTSINEANLKNTTEMYDLAVDAAHMLSSGIGDAFAQSIIEGENFREAMDRVFKDLGKMIIAQIVKMLALKALMALIGGPVGAVGSTAISGANIGANAGGIGSFLSGIFGNRVSTGVSGGYNSGGSVEFEIRGDKLYGVLQNYTTRLDRLV